MNVKSKKETSIEYVTQQYPIQRFEAIFNTLNQYADDLDKGLYVKQVAESLRHSAKDGHGCLNTIKAAFDLERWSLFENNKLI